MKNWIDKAKIAVVVNIFDGEEHLMDALRPWRQLNNVYIIAVTQEISNRGNAYSGGHNKACQLQKNGWVHEIIPFQPYLYEKPMQNETRKRNIGLDVAKQKKCTHFIMLDCDEVWLIDDVRNMQPDTAHRIITYFASEHLILDPPEDYYVPGIVTLHKETKVGAYNCGFYCDPTRKPNHKLTEGRAWMHHYSYVRNNMERKIDNSSARENIEKKRKLLFGDLENAKDGYYSEFLSRKLKKI